MAKIRAYTTIEQSRKLVEILPLESADMSWVSNGLGKPFARTISIKGDPEELCACWSLAALLGVFPEIQGDKPVIFLYDNYITYPHMSGLHTKADNLVDACVEMIKKLHELKML